MILADSAARRHLAAREDGRGQRSPLPGIRAGMLSGQQGGQLRPRHRKVSCRDNGCSLQHHTQMLHKYAESSYELQQSRNLVKAFHHRSVLHQNMFSTFGPVTWREL